MVDPTMGPKARAADKLPAAHLSWTLRFSPQVIVFLLMLLAAIPPLRGVIVSGTYWWWDKTYAQVEFVMDEARPNDGSPYIAGHIAGSTEQTNLLGQMMGTTMVVRGVPHETFAAGKRIYIWHSRDAPNSITFGESVNDVPIATLPERPGLITFFGYLAWLLATLVVGFALTGWVASRWSRTYSSM